MFGYIYKTTNVVNGKIYIGQHKSDVFDPNYLGSGKILRSAFDKYGTDNFIVELLVECDSREDMNKCEEEQIALHNSRDMDIGYNIAYGGYGGDVFSMKSDEEKDAIRKANHDSMLGRVLINNGEVQKRVKQCDLQKYLDNGFVIGYLHTVERDERRKSALRKFHDEHPEFRNDGMFKPGSCGFKGSHTDETKQKIREKLIGVKQSKETCELKSKLLKERYANGWQNPCKGKVPWNKGMTGTNFGRVWVNNGDINKMVLLSELDNYFENGYVRGRLKRLASD